MLGLLLAGTLGGAPAACTLPAARAPAVDRGAGSAAAGAGRARARVTANGVELAFRLPAWPHAPCRITRAAAAGGSGRLLARVVLDERGRGHWLDPLAGPLAAGRYRYRVTPIGGAAASTGGGAARGDPGAAVELELSPPLDRRLAAAVVEAGADRVAIAAGAERWRDAVRAGGATPVVPVADEGAARAAGPELPEGPPGPAGEGARRELRARPQWTLEALRDSERRPLFAPYAYFERAERADRVELRLLRNGVLHWSGVEAHSRVVDVPRCAARGTASAPQDSPIYVDPDVDRLWWWGDRTSPPRVHFYDADRDFTGARARGLRGP